MTIEELEKRERDAYEAFMEADWMHADMRLNEWLDAAHELTMSLTRRRGCDCRLVQASPDCRLRALLHGLQGRRDFHHDPE